MKYLCDDARHLICVPYSVENLHRMAAEFGIKRCWFHGDHYDMPKKRMAEIKARCVVVSSKKIVDIVRRPVMTEQEIEEKLDRFIVFLSRTDPDKTIPSRNMAREVLLECLSKKEKKDEQLDAKAAPFGSMAEGVFLERLSEKEKKDERADDSGKPDDASAGEVR